MQAHRGLLGLTPQHQGVRRPPGGSGQSHSALTHSGTGFDHVCGNPPCCVLSFLLGFSQVLTIVYIVLFFNAFY